MPSPFPGMDPFLEDAEIWEDFHASLAAEIRDQITPHLIPRYYAALTPRITYDEVLVEETQVAKPDVSVLQVSERPVRGGGAEISPAPVVGLLTLEAPVK